MNACKPISLATVRRGNRALITRLRGAEEGVLRLRELGLGEGRLVRVLEVSDPLLCQIDGSRVGVSRSLAAGIDVRPLVD